MAHSRFDDVRARQIYDSRARPTVEVEVRVGDVVVRAHAPSGASVGAHEAVELRDAPGPGPTGVGRAVGNVRGVVRDALLGLDVMDQRTVDDALCALDGTADKSHLGANAMLPVSLAACRAAAVVRGVELYEHIADLAGTTPAVPTPMVNMISGGLHSGSTLELQDFLVIPLGVHRFDEQLRRVVAFYWTLGELLTERGLGRLVGDEGGYAPSLDVHEDALQLLGEAGGRADLELGVDLAIGLDVAATHFWDGSAYRLRELDRPGSAEDVVQLLAGWCSRHPIVSIEDPLAEDDWAGWQLATERFAELQVVGDDLFTTNPERLARGIRDGCANALLLKMNQIGTLSETLAVCRQAIDAGYAVVASARSGETEDDFLADLAVGVAAHQIKIGSVARSERLAKYNRLLRVAELLE